MDQKDKDFGPIFKQAIQKRWEQIDRAVKANPASYDQGQLIAHLSPLLLKVDRDEVKVRLKQAKECGSTIVRYPASKEALQKVQKQKEDKKELATLSKKQILEVYHSKTHSKRNDNRTAPYHTKNYNNSEYFIIIQKKLFSVYKL